jgi:hypothetical protein
VTGVSQERSGLLDGWAVRNSYLFGPPILLPWRLAGGVLVQGQFFSGGKLGKGAMRAFLRIAPDQGK